MRGNPRQRPLSAVSWRHGDMETGRDGDRDTRGSRDSVTVAGIWETFVFRFGGPLDT